MSKRSTIKFEICACDLAERIIKPYKTLKFTLFQFNLSCRLVDFKKFNLEAVGTSKLKLKSVS